MTPSGDQVASAVAGAATTGAAAWLSFAGNVAVQLLGVPLPVVVAAIAGALLARVYLPTIAFASALGRSVLWVVTGCVTAQGVSAVVTLPVGVLGISALLISGLGPRLWPVIVDASPELLKNFLSKLGGKAP
jgi:hypothetical protein